MPKIPEQNQVASPDYAVAGAQLREVRQERGILLEEMASALHIKTDLLELLEQGAVERIPGGLVYARGHLRMYARFLALDLEAVLGAPLPLPVFKKRAASLSRSDEGKGRGALLASLGALLVAGAMWYAMPLLSLKRSQEVELVKPVPTELEAYLASRNAYAPGKKSPCIVKNSGISWPPCYTLQRQDWLEERMVKEPLSSVLYLK